MVIVITSESYTINEVRKEVDVNNFETTIKPTITASSTTQSLTTEKINEMQVYFENAQDAFRKNNYKLAIYYWQKVLEIDPKHQLSQTNIDRTKKLLETH